jgi:hypothetical protein
MPAWGVGLIIALSFVFQGGAIDVGGKIGVHRKGIPTWWIHKALLVTTWLGWLIVLVGFALGRLHVEVATQSSNGVGNDGSWHSPWSTLGWSMAAGSRMFDWLWLRSHLHGIRRDAINVPGAQVPSSPNDVLPPVAR